MKRWMALAGLVLAAPATADWQYTKWGMSVDEVKAASGGALRDSPASGSGAGELPRDVALLEGIHEAAGHPFDVFLYFDKETRHLSMVMLRSDSDSACGAIRNSLSNRGKSEIISSESGSELMVWRDSERQNLIRFKNMEGLKRASYGAVPHSCIIQYRSIVPPDDGT